MSIIPVKTHLFTPPAAQSLCAPDLAFGWWVTRQTFSEPLIPAGSEQLVTRNSYVIVGFELLRSCLNCLNRGEREEVGRRRERRTKKKKDVLTQGSYLIKSSGVGRGGGEEEQEQEGEEGMRVERWKRAGRRRRRDEGGESHG